ncbi:MAG TPA: NfeD family protein [Solirubrobacteraceae bacterium]|jgi:membrane-bound serine protease (ClpP class)|nr:NfeD family protein [Solirubrobacteraceae bacterium]
MTALGLVLLALGATLVVLEAHVSSLGALGLPGVLALVGGSALAVSGLGGSLLLVVGVAVLLAVASIGAAVVVVPKGAAVRRRRVRTGAEGMIGQVGVVRSWDEPGGSVLLGGALWRARKAWPAADTEQLRAGDEVVVERLGGLTLGVRRAEEWELLL